MLIDASLIMDNGLALTTTGSSTNYIDTVGAAGGQAQISGVNTIQGGYDAYESDWLVAEVLTAFTASGTSLDVQFWTASVIANIWATSNGTVSISAVAGQTVKLISSGAIAVASLTKGAVLVKGRIPAGCQRFISAYYVCVGTLATGTIAAMIAPDVDINLT